MVDGGYEFFAKRQLVTLFSAPNYCGVYDNAGAVMNVDETIACYFEVSLHTTPMIIINNIIYKAPYSCNFRGAGGMADRFSCM